MSDHLLPDDDVDVLPSNVDPSAVAMDAADYAEPDEPVTPPPTRSQVAQDLVMAARAVQDTFGWMAQPADQPAAAQAIDGTCALTRVVTDLAALVRSLAQRVDMLDEPTVAAAEPPANTPHRVGIMFEVFGPESPMFAARLGGGTVAMVGPNRWMWARTIDAVDPWHAGENSWALLLVAIDSAYPGQGARLLRVEVAPA